MLVNFSSIQLLASADDQATPVIDHSFSNTSSLKNTYHYGIADGGQINSSKTTSDYPASVQNNH